MCSKFAAQFVTFRIGRKMWCTTRISRTWFIISGLKDLASLFATDFLDICPLRSKNLTVVMCLREDNNFRLLACCLQFFYGIQSFRPVGSQILDLPQQLPPEYRFIAPVIWFGYSIFLRLPKFSELSSSKLSNLARARLRLLNFQTQALRRVCGSSPIEISRICPIVPNLLYKFFSVARPFCG